MADDAGPDALVLTGPTAAGKTALALHVATRLDGEIISMDSRQVYRGMDIGTAKATPEERARVPHHGLDLVEPGARYNAGRFARDARRWIREIHGRGGVPLLVGGTGFFLRALTHPLFREPPLDPDRRAALEAFLDDLPDATLRAWLRRLDPGAAARLERGGGRQRVLRALELPLLTGRTLDWWQRHRPAEAEPLRPLIFVLDLPVDVLDRRIDARVTAMMTAGLVEETERLLAGGARADDAGMSATGYTEAMALIRGEIDRDEAAERIRHATRRYARRQRTWFRTQLPPGAVWLDGLRSRDELVEEVVERWRAGH